MAYTVREMPSGRWIVLDELQQSIISTDSEEDALAWIRSDMIEVLTTERDAARAAAERYRKALEIAERVLNNCGLTVPYGLENRRAHENALGAIRSALAAPAGQPEPAGEE